MPAFSTSLISLLLLSVPTALGQAQVPIIYDAIHNATTIIGTWSSGSGGTQTGPGYCNPVNQTFFPPKTSGISYSFSSDGYFEQAEFRFGSNATMPACVSATMIYQHGNYSLNPNGTITLFPIESDGLVQTQNACAAVSSVVTQFSAQFLFSYWRIYQDPTTQDYHLHLFEFDGTPKAPMTRRSTKPIMLPSTTLVGNPATQTANSRRKRDGVQKRSGAVSSTSQSWMHVAFAGVAVFFGTLLVFVL